MNFSSGIVFLFLIIAVILSWLPPKRFQVHYISLIGCLFLGYADYLSMIILLICSLITYYTTKTNRVKGKYVSIIISILVVVFIYYKRRQFIGGENIVIPLGLSYYLFRQIHYIFEKYKGTLRKHNFLEYLSFLLLLPPLLVGPIHRFPEFINDLRRRRWNWERFSLGLERSISGYAKLIIIANFLLSNYLEAWIKENLNFEVDFINALVNSSYMWLDLYIRFSAYSDIAIGFSAMMGFKIMENFNNPFLAKNINDFWKRWHISLTSWCGEYVYKPIAAITRKSNFAILSSMAVIGLWHEFSLRYLLWGFYHAIGIAIQRRWKKLRNKLPENSKFKRLESICGTILTIIFVISSFPVTSWLKEVIFK